MQMRTLATGLGLVESPRWHDGRLWFADWTAGGIFTLEADGSTRLVCEAAAPPLSFDFDPDGSMLVVASGADHLLRQGVDGRLMPFAPFGSSGAWNEIVVDAQGRIYVNGPALLLVHPDRRVESQAQGFEFPNGMALSPDGRTLLCAESWGRRLTAFDVDQDGRLSGRRIWAQLEGPPDGICFDAQCALWYADVPNAYCRRVREGGEVLDELKFDRGAFACMLGGPERRTLFVTSAKWCGMERMGEMGGTGQILSVDVATPGAGWPFN